MIKPKQEITKYYDWFSAWDYVKEKYGFTDETEDEENSYIWNYIVDTYNIHNGSYFTISNFELEYDNGKFSYLIPDWFKPIVKALLDEFGEPNDCPDGKGREATFNTCW